MYRLKPLFLSENKKLEQVLFENGFCLALYTHPSIVFGERKDANKHTGCWGLRIVFLKKCIRIGLLEDERGHKLMRELGIQPYFGNGVEFWFEESHSPIKPYHLPEVEKPQGRLAVYTALTGDYDEVHEILYKEKDVDYILFTNNPLLKSKTWQVIVVESELNDTLLSREIKMFPDKYLGSSYDMSIYVDANMVIYGELSELTKYLSKEKPFAVSRHGERNSVREEIDACAKIVGIDRDKALAQYDRYVEEGFSDDMGLAECSILVRKHNQKTVVELMNLWWKEFVAGVRRDQLSLLPCMDKTCFIGLAWMEKGYARHNQYCRAVAHK